jgi:anhydro-N-acetylmuramic acid kinase
MNSYKVLGLMSGTSLDGLDIACVEFRETDGIWAFQVLKATTVSYDLPMKKYLTETSFCSGAELIKRHVDFGKYLGNQVKDFIQQHDINVDLISSHGHTIFHQPQHGYTFQLGEGQSIYAITNIPVVFDFRSQDVALGGQGAPLVPMGDKMLFEKYDACINLGGISNISFEKENHRVAFDVSPLNMVLNYLAEKLGKSMDENGMIASTGRMNENLFHQLNGLGYYTLHGPKSIGREWVEKEVIPMLDASMLSVSDQLHIFTRHAAFQMAQVLNMHHLEHCLITGGGAYNQFFVHCLKEYSRAKFIIPDKEIIEFKEALIFAFLGLLRKRNQINVLSDVTGATHDHSSGLIVGG